MRIISEKKYIYAVMNNAQFRLNWATSRKAICVHRLKNALDKDVICVGEKGEHRRESEILSALIICKILHYHKLPLFQIFLELETWQDHVGNSSQRDSSLQCRRIFSSHTALCPSLDV